MSSLYAKYLKERTNDHILETEQGFATYRYLNKTQVYIIDIFVLPEFRRQHIGRMMFEKICAEAKSLGCTEVIGSVAPNAKNANDSLKAIVSYGMSVLSVDAGLIFFKKGL
jgi:GNAT superfamily N-acetyltransferase